MRPEDQNPLDLNNFPDDYSRDGKQVLLEDASSGCRKKRSGGKEGKEECGKVYECRFCSLKFCKSQALGGHMNRHRQERETETLNHARQLVFRNDHSIVAQGQVAPHLGCCNNVGGDPTMSVRFPRYLSASSSSSSQASQSYLYASSSFGSHHYPVGDYYVGHGHAFHNHHNYVGSSSSTAAAGGSGESAVYTCIGAPVVGHGFGGGGAGDEGSLLHRLDPPSVINRFQDGF